MKKKNENETKNAPLLYGDHKTPVTRRDFLASGLLGMSTLALSSSALSLFSQSVWAQSQCPQTAALMTGNIPFLCLDCAGGMNIAGGNAMIGQFASEFQGEVGTVSTDYVKLGIPSEFHPSKTGMINKDFGLKFHSSSGILAGMNEVLAPRAGESKDLRQYVDGAILGAITNDDTQNNPLNTVYMAHKAGAIGQLVQLVGNQNSNSGGNSISPADQIDLTKKPSQLTNFESSEGLLSIGQNIMGPNFLNAGGTDGNVRLKRFMELLGRSGSSQRNAIGAKSQALGNEVSKYQQRLDGTNAVFNQFSPAQLNPTKNTVDGTVLADVYGKAITAFDGNEIQSSNILNLLTKRTVGAGTISVGGGDYHNGTATTGQAKDVEIGRYIGWGIRMAAARNTPFFIHVFTDGGVVGDAAGQVDPQLPNRVLWRSDDGTRSAALMIVFNPNKMRAVVGGNDEYSNFLLSNKTRQIGYYKPGGGSALDAHSLSNNVSKLWIGIILNYMATMVNSTDDDQIRSVVSEQFRCRFGDLPADWAKLIRFRSLIA